MLNYLLLEISHLILLFVLPFYTVFACSCNSRNREQTHLQRRQALRDRQRQAVLSGRSVRSVIETEVDSETTQCPNFSCVRMAPRLKETDYERVARSNESSSRAESHEKPPYAVVGEKKNYSSYLMNDHSTSSESLLTSLSCK